MLANALLWTKRDSDTILRVLALRRAGEFPRVWGDRGQFWIESRAGRERTTISALEVMARDVEREIRRRR